MKVKCSWVVMAVVCNIYVLASRCPIFSPNLFPCLFVYGWVSRVHFRFTVELRGQAGVVALFSVYSCFTVFRIDVIKVALNQKSKIYCCFFPNLFCWVLGYHYLN